MQGDFILKIEPPLGWSFGKIVCSHIIIVLYANCTSSFYTCIGAFWSVITLLLCLYRSSEPTSVDLHVDGVSDICTKEEDINFVFTGFSVSGTVRILKDCLTPLMGALCFKDP